MRKTTPHAIDLYKCNAAYEGGINQKFSFDPATGQLSSELYSSMTSCVAVCEKGASNGTE